MPPLPSYILITPARNEARYIEATIQAMIAQTHRPLKWVIASDGSSDSTDEIVRSYLAEHDWIELFRMPEREERNFAGKAHAFNAGYERVKSCGFEVIGNLDADVTFDADHFEYLIEKMADSPDVGVAGSPFREGKHQYDFRFTNIENVWGGCQLFRRACFEAIGGYQPLRNGCIDHVAVLSARMKGWKTLTFIDKVCLHHRKMGTALKGELRAKIKHGEKDYMVGNHPLWEMLRAVYQMKRRPLLIGGLALGVGYTWSLIRRREIILTPELIAFARKEQIQRLRNVLTGNAPKKSGHGIAVRRSAPLGATDTPSDQR
jgi:glycosyltransferase involved in cell wall biosynthesis